MNKLYLLVPFLIVTALLMTAFNWGRAGYKNITPEEALKMIKKDDNALLLLDVRTAGEYRSGHIKGSTLIPVQELSGKTSEISGYRESDVIIYCAVGGRSSRASNFLSGQGFKKVYNMVGGFNEWSRLGYKTER